MSFPRVYTSFAEFEREEIRKLDSMRTTVDDMMEERFSTELDFGEDSRDRKPKRRGRPPKRSY